MLYSVNLPHRLSTLLSAVAPLLAGLFGQICFSAYFTLPCTIFNLCTTKFHRITISLQLAHRNSFRFCFTTRFSSCASVGAPVRSSYDVFSFSAHIYLHITFIVMIMHRGFSGVFVTGFVIIDVVLHVTIFYRFRHLLGIDTLPVICVESSLLYMSFCNSSQKIFSGSFWADRFSRSARYG